VVFGLLVSQYIGSGAAWFSILLAGAVGNAINAYLYQTLHLSIGASTMVFGALGMLGIFALNDRHSYAQQGIRRWAPLLATLALLGFLGTSGERTDIMAHLTGYLSGCITSLIWMSALRRTDNHVLAQSTYALAAVILVILAWALALG
jgi:rhomboid protease GluP